MKILIAGIGNIFYRDDAFGCEVVCELQRRKVGQASSLSHYEVTVTDFGVRSYDLVYALTDGFDAVILVDAISRGQSPGTVFLIEPDVAELKKLEHAAIDAHTMNPVSVIQMAQTNGGISAKLFLVGCEPEVLENETGEMGLSESVREAFPQAVTMIESLVEKLLEEKDEQVADLVPA